MTTLSKLPHFSFVHLHRRGKASQDPVTTPYGEPAASWRVSSWRPLSMLWLPWLSWPLRSWPLHSSWLFSHLWLLLRPFLLSQLLSSPLLLSPLATHPWCRGSRSSPERPISPQCSWNPPLPRLLRGAQSSQHSDGPGQAPSYLRRLSCRSSP